MFLYVPVRLLLVFKLRLLLVFTIAADTAIWNRLESIGIPWNLLGDVGKHWNYLESDESNLYSLEFIVPRGLLSTRRRFGSDSVDEVAFLFFAIELPRHWLRSFSDGLFFSRLRHLSWYRCPEQFWPIPGSRCPIAPPLLHCQGCCGLFRGSGRALAPADVSPVRLPFAIARGSGNAFSGHIDSEVL